MAASGATTSVLSNRLRGGLSQLLALAAVVVVLVIHFGLGTAGHVSLYLLSIPLLLLCAGLGGAAATVSATLALAAVAFVLEAGASPIVERLLRLGVFTVAGLGVAYAVHRLHPRAAAAPRTATEAPVALPRTEDDLPVHLAAAWNQSSMNEMASVLSHELNQPLSALANYLRAARTLIVRHELQDDTLINAVDRAGDQAVRAGQIVRTMRELATRGGTQLRDESLSSMLREVQFILNTLAKEPGVRVTYRLYDGDDIVLADRIQIQQLVVNLARNAIQAMSKSPSGQLRITTVLESDGELVTSVEDNGPGIDPAVLARPFLPLSSTSPDRMGLGLSICSGIVHNHKGRIWVESSPEGGAAFRFGLPRVGGDGDASRGGKDGLRRR